jgi:hypothetical protein
VCRRRCGGGATWAMGPETLPDDATGARRDGTEISQSSCAPSLAEPCSRCARLSVTMRSTLLLLATGTCTHSIELWCPLRPRAPFDNRTWRPARNVGTGSPGNHADFSLVQGAQKRQLSRARTPT